VREGGAVAGGGKGDRLRERVSLNAPMIKELLLLLLLLVLIMTRLNHNSTPQLHPKSPSGIKHLGMAPPAPNNDSAQCVVGRSGIYYLLEFDHEMIYIVYWNSSMRRLWIGFIRRLRLRI